MGSKNKVKAPLSNAPLSNAPLSNAKRPKGPQLIVDVTHAIMEHARVRDSSHCMIAMAVRDIMPEMRSIAVDLQTIRFTNREKGYRYTFLTHRIAQVALVQFDQGIMPEPFKFRLTGAHVTKMLHKPKVQTPRSMSEAQKAGLIKANRVLHGEDNARLDKLKTTLATPRSKTERLLRVGGTPPPLGNFARRREFGLKGLRI
jgi:hypothetical protein